MTTFIRPESPPRDEAPHATDADYANLSLEPSFDAATLLADQDAAIAEAERFIDGHCDDEEFNGEVADGDMLGSENTEFLFEADDWDTDLKRTTDQAQADLVKAHIKTAEGKGFRSPEAVRAEKVAAAERAEKHTFWRYTSIILFVATVLTLVASLWLSGGAA